jgi:hypothetical protein
MKRASAERSADRLPRDSSVFSEGTFLIAVGGTILLAAAIATIIL